LELFENVTGVSFSEHSVDTAVAIPQYPGHHKCQASE